MLTTSTSHLGCLNVRCANEKIDLDRVPKKALKKTDTCPICGLPFLEGMFISYSSYCACTVLILILVLILSLYLYYTCTMIVLYLYLCLCLYLFTCTYTSTLLMLILVLCILDYTSTVLILLLSLYCTITCTHSYTVLYCAHTVLVPCLYYTCTYTNR